MRGKFSLLRRFDELRTSYWFVPAVMVVGAILLAIVIQLIDARVAYGVVPGLRWLSATGPDGARSILATIAGSTITVTSVIFSITIVAISMASNQFGRRLIRNFMRSGGAQFALGLFLACFVYCLLILSRIPAHGDGQAMPYLSVGVGIVFGIACFLGLIYYIHHIATFIQAPQIIHNVTEELLSTIARIYPEREDGKNAAAAEKKPVEWSGASVDTVVSEDSGYVLTIDLDLLFDIAVQNDAAIDVQVRAGQFCVFGEPLITTFSRGGLSSDCRTRCRQAVELGTQRSPTQDAEFTLNQLVEIGIRALSPGINDPFTAINCIDRIGAALTFLASRKSPKPTRCDGEGVLRLRFIVDAHETLARSAFDQLRQHARGNPAVLIRMLEVIEQIARVQPDNEFTDSLRLEADLIHAAAGSISAEFDRQCLGRTLCCGDRRSRRGRTCLRRIARNAAAVLVNPCSSGWDATNTEK